MVRVKNNPIYFNKNVFTNNNVPSTSLGAGAIAVNFLCPFMGNILNNYLVGMVGVDPLKRG